MTDQIAPFAVAGIEAVPGSLSEGYASVDVGETTLQLPISIAHGDRPGPVLAITAGIHGGEYVAMLALREFMAGLDVERMSGTIVASLQSSPASFEGRSAFVNPMDGKNLNRSFPGSPDGTPTDRLAHWLWTNILSRADVCVDCHGGDLPEHLDGFAGIRHSADPAVDERSRRLADCFDVSRVMYMTSEGSTLHTAAAHGVPSVLIEVGGEGRWAATEIAVQREGLRRLAAEAGVLDGPGAAGRDPLPVYETAGGQVISEHAGYWFPAVTPGTPVSAGQLLGRVEGAFGEILQEAHSPFDGLLAYGLASLAAQPGAVLAATARPLG